MLHKLKLFLKTSSGKLSKLLLLINRKKCSNSHSYTIRKIWDIPLQLLKKSTLYFLETWRSCNVTLQLYVKYVVTQTFLILCLVNERCFRYFRDSDATSRVKWQPVTNKVNHFLKEHYSQLSEIRKGFYRSFCGL